MGFRWKTVSENMFLHYKGQKMEIKVIDHEIYEVNKGIHRFALGTGHMTETNYCNYNKVTLADCSLKDNPLYWQIVKHKYGIVAGVKTLMDDICTREVNIVDKYGEPVEDLILKWY